MCVSNWEEILTCWYIPERGLMFQVSGQLQANRDVLLQPNTAAERGHAKKKKQFKYCTFVYNSVIMTSASQSTQSMQLNMHPCMMYHTIDATQLSFCLSVGNKGYLYVSQLATKMSEKPSSSWQRLNKKLSSVRLPALYICFCRH